ncbi:ricin-type beta-trefoil lectin domain protein [Streptomyces goshikiensis]|uniref:ricin-type beta-trefoil lectin domain protein n=1 Tax=Streptomyces goshikiensis TaxID=1942 RepID=UPI0036C9D4A6
MTDQQLCDAIRTAAPAAPSAETELRRRHGPRTSAFARTALGGDHLSAQRAADRATEQFLGMLAAATDALDRPPRLSLLTLVSASASPAPSAPSGAGPDERAGQPAGVPLDPALRSFVRNGFTALPPRTQAVLWHSVVEREPDDHVATITGDRPDSIPDLAHRALAACRDAFLRVHLQARPSPHCPAYARMLDAAADRADVRGNPDLTRHVDGCPGCAAALRGLVALCDTPGPLLAASLLGPAGPLYLSAATHTDGDTGTGTDAEDDTLPLPVATATAAGGRPTPAVRVSLGVAAVLITTTALAVVVPAAWGPEPPDAAQGQPPRAHVEAGGAGSPAPSGSRARPSTSASPHRSPSASPSATRPSPSDGPSPGDGPTPSPTLTTEVATADPVQPFRASAYVPAVNSATGLCLDVRGGTFANGVDVITAHCRAGAPVQQWRLDDRGLLRNAANPGYCMDARGSAGDGVGIWSCSAFGRAEGNNLVFSTDATGRIKPRIAPGYAVTSGSGPGAPVVFGRTGQAAEQRWNEPTRATPSSR